jgi:hypothetical protein
MVIQAWSGLIPGQGYSGPGHGRDRWGDLPIPEQIRRILTLPSFQQEPAVGAIPLMVELCAGTAALSLRLQGGRHARPPVSRQGSKQGYAGAILRALGLRSGQGAERYLWCEPDPGCRLLLLSYTDKDLRDKAAEVIRGWKDEDPRALWERLRAEGPVKEPEPREVARWLTVLGWSQQREPDRLYEPGQRQDPAKSGIGNIDSLGRHWGVSDQAWIAGRLDGCSTLPASILPDARPLQPASLPPGTVAYIDPPYLGHLGQEPTTGYGHALSRDEVCTMAEKWASAGAWVVISESAPLVELSGWHSCEITGERIGQKRTFSKQKREFLTSNRPFAWTPARQGSLFAMGAK